MTKPTGLTPLDPATSSVGGTTTPGSVPTGAWFVRTQGCVHPLKPGADRQVGEGNAKDDMRQQDRGEPEADADRDEKHQRGDGGDDLGHHQRQGQRGIGRLFAAKTVVGHRHRGTQGQHGRDRGRDRRNDQRIERRRLNVAVVHHFNVPAQRGPAPLADRPSIIERVDRQEQDRRIEKDDAASGDRTETGEGEQE